MLIRRRRQPRQRFSWRTLAFEVFVVVLGVTLALGANELRQRFLDRQRVQAALEGIAAEMQYNCDQFTRTRTYYERVLEDVDSLRAVRPEVVAQGSFEDFMQAIPSWKGYNPARATRVAYETAQATGALALMPYERALGLGRYYTFVALYQSATRQAVGAVMQSGEPTAGQMVTVVGVTSDLQRQLGPMSCAGVHGLSGEADESSPPS